MAHLYLPLKTQGALGKGWWCWKESKSQSMVRSAGKFCLLGRAIVWTHKGYYPAGMGGWLMTPHLAEVLLAANGCWGMGTIFLQWCSLWQVTPTSVNNPTALLMQAVIINLMSCENKNTHESWHFGEKGGS